MQVVVYDGSFKGLLSAVFDCYEYKFTDVHIVQQDRVAASLFGTVHIAHTDQQKAARVSKGLERYIDRQAVRNLYVAWLSEKKDIEDVLLRYMQYVFRKKINIDRDYSNPDVLYVSQTVKKVHREKHRMEAFVRFQLTKDKLYYAIVQPDFNVLSLISPHFEKRYADQRWMIYDAQRKYGIYYDLHSVQEVYMQFDEGLKNGTAIETIHDENENLYQRLWMQYFSSVNIAARKNTPLHIRHMPKRYWKYLPEKRKG